MLDISHYERSERLLSMGNNKKIISLIKDEVGSEIIMEKLLE